MVPVSNGNGGGNGHGNGEFAEYRRLLLNALERAEEERKQLKREVIDLRLADERIKGELSRRAAISGGSTGLIVAVLANLDKITAALGAVARAMSSGGG